MAKLKFKDVKVSYFSAEIGIRPEIKTYAGGLGILAGDYLKTAADAGYEMCGVTLLYKNGFFRQKINDDNEQVEEKNTWDYERYLEDTGKVVKVNIQKRDVLVKVWVYWLEGKSSKIPIFFLDTDLKENNENDRHITSHLYQGDRLKQELVLGIGGLRALNELGVVPDKYHMNEGHSSFLTLELYRTLGKKEGYKDEVVKKRCVFTTHTPISAGHDKFNYTLFHSYVEGEVYDLIPWHMQKLAGDKELNTTRLAMSLSGYINAVSKKHQEVTKGMFSDKAAEIDFVTNGIHLPTWISEPFKDLYKDKELTKGEGFDKKVYPASLKKAKAKAKKELVEYVNKNAINEVKFDEKKLTFGFARRFISYKNAEMIFRDIERLQRLGDKVQFVFAGKSHMSDNSGKRIITRLLEYAEMLKGEVQIAFIENYDMDVAKKLVSGVDIWLNTPLPPHEASGTSGMKAAANGTIHMSTLDGWAPESYEKGLGGFPIPDVESFYDILEYKILPTYFYDYEDAWLNEMQNTIKNAAYFNTYRMLEEYKKRAYS